MSTSTDILFLHHSTGHCVWRGGVPEWFKQYNQEHGTQYRICEMAFPKSVPYGWKNYPHDYWNIWVNHAGPAPYMTELTLEALTPHFPVIVFKHCFPVCAVQPDTGAPDIASPEKRAENYKLQYEALKKKLHEFPQNKFIVWTGAALTQGATNEADARRAQEFFNWVRTSWDEKGDNIFLWDFYQLETEGGLYLKDEYANGPRDSHPNEAFCRKAAPDFCRRIVDVIEGREGE